MLTLAALVEATTVRWRTGSVEQGKTVTKKTEIFVFGSNLSGVHGKGAALWAKRVHGAIQGHGVGLQGNSYAIPTKGKYDGAAFKFLSLDEIQAYVNEFCIFAERNSNMHFNLTAVGCGLAGFMPEQIAPMFRYAWDKRLANISFPPEFIQVLSSRTLA